MDCRDVVDRLSPFLDDELDPVASRDVSRHLESCPRCAGTLARLRELGAAVTRELEYHRASDLLRERVMRDLGAAGAGTEHAAERPARRRWGWLGAAAAVIALAGGTWTAAALLGARGEDAIARDVVSGHIRSLMADHLTDVASTDQHTVKPWFAGRLDFSPPVTDFAAAGYPLTGGRLDYLQGHTVAALVYMHRKHVINVFVWPLRGSGEAIGPVVTERGFHVIRAGHAGMAYWLVSDLNAEELALLARRLTART